MRLEALGKYFLHGVLFSLLYLVLFFAWFFLLLILVGVGFIIGLIIGIVVLFLMVGYVNMVLSSYIWHIESDSGTWGIFLHGVALFIILLIVNFFTSILPSLVFPGVATLVAAFVISSFFDGYVGKNVALWFGREVTETGEASGEEAALPPFA